MKRKSISLMVALVLFVTPFGSSILAAGNKDCGHAHDAFYCDYDNSEWVWEKEVVIELDSEAAFWQYAKNPN